MKTFEHQDEEQNIPRSHPWTVALAEPSHKYYDFKKSPEIIRTSLEDFRLWNDLTAIGKFYDLLEWLNGPYSLLESNDCGTRGPTENRSPKFAKSMEWTVRLMILYRDLKTNTVKEAANWLAGATRHYLKEIDPEFEWGVVGTTLKPTNYVTLPVPEHEQAGAQVMLTFWAWGDTEVELQSNLGRVFRNTHTALIEVCGEIRESTANAPKDA